MRRYLSIIVVSLLLASCGEDRADLVAVGTLERDRIEIVAEAWETLTAIEVSEGPGDVAHRGQIGRRPLLGCQQTSAEQGVERVLVE